MILILIALLVISVGGITMIKNCRYDSVGKMVGGLLLTAGSLGLLFYVSISWFYIAAGFKQEIINAEFDTNYTQEQIFYASDVIDEIRELKRQRIELNGNLGAE